MCPYERSPSRVEKNNANTDSDHARMALDSLIDFAIECVMEFHEPGAHGRNSSAKRDLCGKV